MPERPWLASPPDLALSSDEVHVWRASLGQPTSRVEQLVRTLSDDERGRAERFHSERDRTRFVVARGTLRSILGHYLGVEPGRVQFEYGPRGKPHMAEPFANLALRFNLAHSHDWALYAFAHHREVGIDLERACPLPDAEEIATRFFSARESAAWRALSPNRRQQAFYLCWTRKEAYIKAIGDGLALPLDQFDVSLAPTEPARLLRVEGNPKEAKRWSLQTLEPAPGYVAALAVEGHGWRLVCWDYRAEMVSRTAHR
jgi:4'-phosphopantetheinyl transferase